MVDRLGRSPGGGHGNPPQHSCLENPMDRGAWWTTVHGVAKNQTLLKQLSMNACHLYRVEEILLRALCPAMGSLNSEFFSQFSHSVVSYSLRPHGLQQVRSPCPITNSWSLLRLVSIELVMPSNHLIFCCPLLLLPSVFPSIRSFLMNQFFASGGQSIGASASASVLPMSIQD